MRLRVRLRAILRRGAAIVALFLGATVQRVWAQGAPGATLPAADDGSDVFGLVAVVAIMAGVMWVVIQVRDRKKAREDEAVALQSHLSDVLLRDAMLARLPVTVTVHIPTWKRSPAIAEVQGHVPTPELRQTVLRVVGKELSAKRSDVRMEDRLMVLPPVAAARAA